MSVQTKINGKWVVQSGGSGASASVITDKTLSKENMAADAKAVGDAISSISSAIGQLIVTLDEEAGTASHSSTEIIAHLNDGVGVILKIPGSSGDRYAQLLSRPGDKVIFSEVVVFDSQTYECMYTIVSDKTYTKTETFMNQKASVEEAAQIQENTEAIANLSAGSNITLDTTLTVEGQAADAKAVGDALNALNVSTIVQTKVLDFTNWANGSFIEILEDDSIITHTVIFNEDGKVKNIAGIEVIYNG